MIEPRDVLFSDIRLRNMTLPNRIIRSATYEGWGESNGTPKPELAGVYSQLARGGVGTIITGFAFVSQAGRAMHPGQCGIDNDEKIAPWRRIVEEVREASPEVKLVMQLAHTGRQTRRQVTGMPLVGASDKPCSYFRQRPHALDEHSMMRIIDEFAQAANRARKAGFDAVQIHAAHGYLIHQFLSPWTNTRTDRWADRPLLLEKVVEAVRSECDHSFPILVKLSAADDNSPGIRVEDTIQTVKRLEKLGIDAIEVSYGTMEYALNIIRGAVPIDAVLNVNPMFNRIPGLLKILWKKFCAPAYTRKFIPYEENYNLKAASLIKAETKPPVILVGGIRTVGSMEDIVKVCGIDAISLCRPLICEPDLPKKLRSGESTRSKCTNCNMCTIYCDSRQPLRCYRGKGNANERC
ncbi:MAG TPA: NADH:flavin oxidoreductase [Armatimonadota bacterium]